MTSKSLCLSLCVSLLSSVGCDAGGGGLDHPDQPKDLGAPWVNRKDTQIGSGMSSGDKEGNHIFARTTNTFDGLIEDIASEFKSPIAVKPKKMMDWNLTVEVKGKTLDEVLQDVATKCKLTLGKTSAGVPLLTHPSDSMGEEFVIKPDAEEAGESDGE